MADTIDVPKLGPVKKPVLYVIGGTAAAFVGWKWWQARSAGADSGAAAAGSDFADGGILPAVSGAVPDDNAFGQGDGNPPSTDTFGFTGTTNSQWTQYVATQLSQSDTWTYTAIVSALGAFVGNRPLSTEQQQIVQAGIALAGYPPEGSHVIVPGGDTKITVAPGGVKAVAKDTTTVTVSWNAVAGAHDYRIYRSGIGENIGTSLDTKADIGGLQPGQRYTFYVAATNGSGAAGPRSAGATATTKKVTLKAPGKPVVKNVGSTTVTASWRAVPGADGYRLYHSHSSGNVGASGDTTATWYGLRKRTTYRIHVRAVDAHGTLGPPSATTTVKTKK